MIFWQTHGVQQQKGAPKNELVRNRKKRISSRVKTVRTTTKVPMRKEANDDGVGDSDHDSPDRYQPDEHKCYFQDNYRNGKRGEGR